jgi:hypothetical protein
MEAVDRSDVEVFPLLGVSAVSNKFAILLSAEELAIVGLEGDISSEETVSISFLSSQVKNGVEGFPLLGSIAVDNDLVFAFNAKELAAVVAEGNIAISDLNNGPAFPLFGFRTVDNSLVARVRAEEAAVTTLEIYDHILVIFGINSNDLEVFPFLGLSTVSN